MPNYRLNKMLPEISYLFAAHRLKDCYVARDWSPKERADFVRSLPKEIELLSEGEINELSLVFELELIPEPDESHRWAPPVNPGRVELNHHLAVFKRGVEQGSLLLTHEMLVVLVASTEEALSTMHELPWAG